MTETLRQTVTINAAGAGGEENANTTVTVTVAMAAESLEAVSVGGGEVTADAFEG